MRITEDHAQVTRLYIEYQIICDFLTQTGTLTLTAYGGGWPITNRHFRIESATGYGGSNAIEGTFTSDFAQVTGTWELWAISYYPPPPLAVCSNTGTWTATQQP